MRKFVSAAHEKLAAKRVSARINQPMGQEFETSRARKVGLILDTNALPAVISPGDIVAKLQGPSNLFPVPLPIACDLLLLESRTRPNMSNILIHKANELKPATRAAVEAELGRSLGDDEDVSIMAFPVHDSPVDEARVEAGRKLEGYFAKIDSRRPGEPDEESDEALKEALKNARPGYHERK